MSNVREPLEKLINKVEDNKQYTLSEKITFSWENPTKEIKNYPLAKTASHFDKKEEKFDCPDFQFLQKHGQTTKRSVVKIHKTPKQESYHDERQKSEWYQISQTELTSKSRYNRISILAGEIFRLIDINQSPKYRIHVDIDNEYLISKGIKNPIEFFTYYNSMYMGNNRIKFFPGMGRQLFIKYFLKDNDIKFENFFLESANKYQPTYFYGIDHEFCFSPYTFQFHTNFFKDFICAPNLTLLDYNNFPLVNNYKVKNFSFTDEDVVGYSKELKKQTFFNNEKHFTALKLLLTNNLQLALVDFHIANPEDNQELKSQLKKQFINLTIVCKQSIPFMKYVQTNRIAAIQAILYELNEFNNDNTHYERINSVKIINNFNQLLETLGEKQLSVEENQRLLTYLEMMELGQKEALKEIKQFYSNQKMAAYEKGVQQKISAIQSYGTVGFFNTKHLLPIEKQNRLQEIIKKICIVM